MVIPDLLFHGKSCFLCRERSRGTGFIAFIKIIAAGDAPLKDFLCCADFKAPQSLRDSSPQGSERQQMQLLATTLSREKANKPAPQGWLVCNKKIIFR